MENVKCTQKFLENAEVAILEEEHGEVNTFLFYIFLKQNHNIPLLDDFLRCRYTFTMEIINGLFD